MPKTSSYHILRVGLGITFVWIGVLILQSPASWSGSIVPSVAGIFPGDLAQFMRSVAMFDLFIGWLFLIDRWTWLAAALGGLHLLLVLLACGINAVTVRDVALIAASASLFWTDLPDRYRSGIVRKAKPELPQ